MYIRLHLSGAIYAEIELGESLKRELREQLDNLSSHSHTQTDRHISTPNGARQLLIILKTHK